jgi:hypothetical protein
MEKPLTRYTNTQATLDTGEVVPNDTLENFVSVAQFNPAKLPDDVLITTKTASEWTRHPTRTFEKWRAEGRGPKFIRCERSIRYRIGDIRNWLSGNSRGEAGNILARNIEK